MAEAFKTLEDGTIVKVTETPVSNEEAQALRTQLEANVTNLRPQVEAHDQANVDLHAQLEEAEVALANFDANVQFPVAPSDAEPAEGVSEGVEPAGESSVDQAVEEPIVTF